MMPRNLDDCYRRYGRLQTSPEGGLLWKEAPEWVTPYKLPNEIVLRTPAGKLLYRIFCNKDIHPALDVAFKNLIISGCHMELETFDGCFNVRWVRGRPGVPSFHSWGIALDFNAAKNPLGGKSSWSENFVTAWELAGFYWGGHFSRPDPQHFEWINRSDTI